MQSQIKTYACPNGDIQRIHLVRWGDWSQLDFLHPKPAEDALDGFAHIYRQFLVPACPWLFGNMVMFRLPEGMDVPFAHETGKYGTVADPLTAAAAALECGVTIHKGKPQFKDEQVRHFWQALEKTNSIRLVSGKLPVTTIIPVGNAPGYLTETEVDSALKVNASFFIMDRFDCATIYDHVGTPIGLCVKDGEVTNPPLFHREALLVRNDGSVSVEMLDVRNLTMEIGGKTYVHGKNAAIHSRPDRARCSGKGTKLVIIGDRVAAVCQGRSVPIPASGFVMRVEGDCHASAGDPVVYRGMENVVFGIQVGNSIVKDGVKTARFLSRFYNIRHLEPVPYPPSLYPLDYENARAARIALGADKDGNPMLLWAEGAAKLGHQPGVNSRGASLSDMADICADVGMVNAINLDGGGSAQLLLNNHRSLQISDRKAADHSEAERPVPLGLVIR